MKEQINWATVKFIAVSIVIIIVCVAIVVGIPYIINTI